MQKDKLSAAGFRAGIAWAAHVARLTAERERLAKQVNERVRATAAAALDEFADALDRANSGGGKGHANG